MGYPYNAKRAGPVNGPVALCDLFNIDGWPAGPSRVVTTGSTPVLGNGEYNGTGDYIVKGSCFATHTASSLYNNDPPYVANMKTAHFYCVNKNTVSLIGFFNGVSNTEFAANASRDRLRKEYGNTYKNRPLKYELFYNQTACGSGLLGLAPCLEDVAEVFAQRNKELGGVLGDRWEIYWEMLAGRQNQIDSITATLLSKLGISGNALLQLIDSIFANILNQLAGSFTKLLTLLGSPATAAETAAHVAKLKTYADAGARMVLVAHSQGNLFVNAAYDGIKASNPAVRAKVVHVAPASPTLRGDYVLANIDLVINGLRVTGINSVPAANINLPSSSKDASGHGFEPTYLDTARAAYNRVKAMITTALDAVTN